MGINHPLHAYSDTNTDTDLWKEKPNFWKIEAKHNVIYDPAIIFMNKRFPQFQRQNRQKKNQSTHFINGVS